MPTYLVTDPQSGRKLRLTGDSPPTDAELEQIFAEQSPTAAKPEESLLNNAGQLAGNLAAGAIRGAGSIGATIVAPYDIYKDFRAGKGLSLDSNRDRRAAMDEGLRSLGADTDSLAFKGAKLGTEIAGTLPVGGLLGKSAQVAGASPKIVSALNSGGFQVGQKGNLLADMLLRTGAGATVGATQAGLVNPEDAAAGAAIGGALPGAAYVAGTVGKTASSKIKGLAQGLMQSAIKPTIKQLKTGEADKAAQVLLKYGISPTRGGIEKLDTLIDKIDDELTMAIDSSGAKISKQRVLDYLDDVRGDFSMQANPIDDMAAIQRSADEFAAHPELAGDQIPVQLAQKIKQGTYRALSKKYGEVGGAATEAQKTLARGLKEEIASAVPEVSPLNAELSDLLTASKVAERRALMSDNLNPLGLAPLAKNPVGAGAFLLDRSTAAKALAARGLNRISDAPLSLQKFENLPPPARSALINLLLTGRENQQ